MDTNDLINEYGIEIARENLTNKMRKLMENKNDEKFKEKLQEIIMDRDEIAKGNINVIKKYMGDVKIG